MFALTAIAIASQIYVGWKCDGQGWRRGLERGFADGWRAGYDAAFKSISAQLLNQGVVLVGVKPPQEKVN
jgi:hypothetical protein